MWRKLPIIIDGDDQIIQERALTTHAEDDAAMGKQIPAKNLLERRDRIGAKYMIPSTKRR